MLITYLKLEKIKMYDLALDITQYLSILYNDIMRILTKWSITSLIAYIYAAYTAVLWGNTEIQIVVT